VVWATGLAPTPFVKSISPLSVQKDEWGHLMTSYGLKVLTPDLLSARGQRGDRGAGGQSSAQARDQTAQFCVLVVPGAGGRKAHELAEAQQGGQQVRRPRRRL
jgi:hypothetical protein